MKNIIHFCLNFCIGFFVYALFSASPLYSNSMSYEEIIAFNKPQWVLLSPDGTQAAYCIRHGSLEENRNIDTLYFIDIVKKSPEKIFSCDEIVKGIWDKNIHAFYLLIKDGKRSQILYLKGNEPSILVDKEDPILLISLSTDGSQLYYTLAKSSTDDIVQQHIEEGYVYRWQQDVGSVIDQKFRHKEWDEVWVLDLKTGNQNIVTKVSYDQWVDHLGGVCQALEISENGKYLLFEMNKLGCEDRGGASFVSGVMVWDIGRGDWFDPLNGSIDINQKPHWLNGTKFIFQQISLLAYEDHTQIYMYDAETHQGGTLEWLTISDWINAFHWDDSNQILYAFSSQSLYKIFLDEQRFEEEKLPKILDQFPAFDHEVSKLAFITEGSNEPPEITFYDLITKEQTKITTLNPQLEKMSLGRVEKIMIQTQSGLKSTGYLIHPVGEESGKRYPIIIGSYGFSGRFITDAEWHSSFPAQTLAGNGYAILLLNHVGSAQGLVGDSEEARKIEGWRMLELFEQAVDDLVEKGIGNPHQVGLYGWSHGGFLVEFLISHSSKFHVACMGEGGDYNPGGFWAIGCSSWPKIYENIFGGPPWGDTLKNYIDFSPFFQVDKIRTPLLLEFAQGRGGFEMYIPLRYLGVPAELVIYEGEEHNFVKPRARIASMARKLEWFDFWFFDRRNPDPKKKEQYERWNKMREEAFKKGVLPSFLAQ